MPNSSRCRRCSPASRTSARRLPRAEQTLAASGRRTILFVDEVHRFNKAQQDAFLPYVEHGLITFIGATTENPSFEVNSALLSRAAVYVLQSLTEDELGVLFDRARAGRRCPDLDFDDDARDAADRLRRRRCAAPAQPAGADAHRRAGRRRDATSMPRSSTRRWRRTCAASTRAATPSTTRSRPCTSRCAAPTPTPRSTGWCACSTAAPIRSTSARRIVRMAVEDIGLADPRAPGAGARSLRTPTSGWARPEGELALAEAVIYLACAAKSNAVYVAYNAARAFVAEDGSQAGAAASAQRADAADEGTRATARTTAMRTTSPKATRRARTTFPRACRGRMVSPDRPRPGSKDRARSSRTCANSTARRGRHSSTACLPRSFATPTTSRRSVQAAWQGDSFDEVIDDLDMK